MNSLAFLGLPSEHDGNIQPIVEQKWDDFKTSSLDGINPRIHFLMDYEYGKIIVKEAFATGCEDDDRVSPSFIKEEIQIFCSESGRSMIEFASDFSVMIYPGLP